MIPAIRTGRRTEAFRQFQYPTVPLHIVPSSLDRARAVLDDAYQQARRASDSEPMRGWP